jgi:hypothetical protein
VDGEIVRHPRNGDDHRPAHVPYGPRAMANQHIGAQDDNWNDGSWTHEIGHRQRKAGILNELCLPARPSQQEHCDDPEEDYAGGRAQ